MKHRELEIVSHARTHGLLVERPEDLAAGREYMLIPKDLQVRRKLFGAFRIFRSSPGPHFLDPRENFFRVEGEIRYRLITNYYFLKIKEIP